MATVTGYTAAHTQALIDAINAVLPAKADLSSGKVLDTQIGANVLRIDTLTLNVCDHGAVGDGTTDDTVAIQAVLNSALPGDTVYLPKTHAVSAPLKIPPQVRLLGRHGSNIYSMVKPTIKPLATFAGAAIILIVDQTTGSYSYVSNEQRIENVTIDCSAVPGATSADGIQAQGLVRGVHLKDVAIYHSTSYGINFVSNASGVASNWHCERVIVTAPVSAGFNAYISNSTWTDCLVSGGSSYGWLMSLGCATNTLFEACRAELNANSGFHIAASTGTGAGSGGPTFIGCTTDRNGQNGVNITASTVGNAPISFIGCTFRRDGSSSTSSGYAGVNISGTAPVFITGCQTHVGPDDAGTGNSSPQYGLTANGGNVSITGGFWRGINEGIHDSGTNIKLARSPNLFEETGAVGSPVDATRGIQTTGTNGASLYVPGNLTGIATPSSHGAIAWVADPTTVSGTVTLNAGIVFLSALYVARSATATKLFWTVSTAGATPTAGQNFVGLYDSNGNRLANVGVDARVTATGMFTETISVALTPGMYWVAWLFNATTPPQLHKVNATALNGTANMLNFNLPTSGLRAAMNGSALTALPSVLTTTSNTAATNATWAAIA